MVIKALVDEIKKGSIKNVLPIGEYNKSVNPGNGTEPYVLVYETPSFIRYKTYSDNGFLYITILAAYPTNYQQALEKYINFELFNMLDKKVLEVVNGDIKTNVKVSVTDRITQIITATSDGYIAKERIVTIPYRWR